MNERILGEDGQFYSLGKVVTVASPIAEVTNLKIEVAQLKKTIEEMKGMNEALLLKIAALNDKKKF